MDEQYENLLQQVNANAQAIEEIREDIADIKEAIRTIGVEPAIDQLKSCDCDSKWSALYGSDLATFKLSGSTLYITLPSTEEAAEAATE